MKIAFGCDPNAMKEKEALMEVVKKLGHEVVDYGSEDPIYANVAFEVGEAVANKDADRGILVCGTGIGMCISANKVKGAYAALLADEYSCERSILSNNANIACFGAFTLGIKVMETLVKNWLSYEYKTGTRSEEKVNRFVQYDRNRG